MLLMPDVRRLVAAEDRSENLSWVRVPLGVLGAEVVLVSPLLLLLQLLIRTSIQPLPHALLARASLTAGGLKSELVAEGVLGLASSQVTFKQGSKGHRPLLDKQVQQTNRGKASGGSAAVAQAQYCCDYKPCVASCKNSMTSDAVAV